MQLCSICQMLAKFLELNSVSKLRSGKENCYLVFMYSVTPGFQKFHIVVMQQRLRNVQESLLQLKKHCCFLIFILIAFCCPCCCHCNCCVTLYTLISKFKFSFVIPVHFQQKQWGEFVEVSIRFMLCDHVRNSHDHFVLYSSDITRRNLMLITVRV